MKKLSLALLALFMASPVFAADPEILDVKVEKSGMLWHIDVTLLHADTGWDHFADGWEVLDSGGSRLGYRQLHHPHMHEQPFTRSLNGLAIPDGTREIFIRAHCSVDNWSGNLTRVVLSP